MPPPTAGLLVPSALLSSRFSRDNLLTPDVVRLYTGAVSARVGVEQLEGWLQELSQRHGPIEVLVGSLGVLSWNIRCRRAGELALLVLPLASDGDGVGGRSKRRVPERCFENARHFERRGLGRFLLPAEQLLDLGDSTAGASFRLPGGHSSLTFRLGSACIDLIDDEGAGVVRLEAAATRQVLEELGTVLAYHYDESDGSTPTDLLVNDGDFLVKRRGDGTFDVRLTCVRHVERGIETNRFLLYLTQLMAYEDWTIGDDLIGLPVFINEPMLAFSGFVRGIGLRYEDLGRTRQAGEDAAREALERFGRSRDGRAYLPWVQHFLAGSGLELPWDPRRPWWNLTELEQRRDLLRLEQGEAAARPLAALVARLDAKVGVLPLNAEDGSLSANDLDRAQVLELFERQGVDAASRELWAEAWFAGWPYRSLRHVHAALPGLPKDGPLPALSFAISPGELEGTLATLELLPTSRPPRALANPEIYGGLRLNASRAEEAIRLLPTFEEYMDSVLHDARFGYYANRVTIGRGGHFSTHPEDLSPHYGRFLASWAFEVRRALIDAGRLSPRDTFPLIEFGAGNGRWARDCIDAVRNRAQKEPAWRAFADCLDYRIYELSDSLRRKQAELLRGDVQLALGDARHPGEALRQDFPQGVTGFIVSNELPDAFGVHKVLLSAEGDAEAVLVVPRIDVELLARLPGALAAACRAADVHLRQRLLLREHLEETLLDRTTFPLVMEFLYEIAESERAAWIDRLWFDEVLVPAGTIGPLAQVLQSGATEYARALAAEESGVVIYVNVHGAAFLRDLGPVLSAGQILTIDYGDTTWGLIQGARRGKFPLRIYCDEGDYEPRPNYPYSRPGGQDLTADVNFTDMARAGLAAGLEVYYYGPERALAGKELPLVLDSTEQKPFATFAGNTVFKLLAVGRGLTWPERDAGLEALSLFTGASHLGAEREGHAQAIQARLERLG